MTQTRIMNIQRLASQSPALFSSSPCPLGTRASSAWSMWTRTLPAVSRNGWNSCSRSRSAAICVLVTTRLVSREDLIFLIWFQRNLSSKEIYHFLSYQFNKCLTQNAQIMNQIVILQTFHLKPNSSINTLCCIQLYIVPMCIFSKNMHHFIADSSNSNFIIILCLIEGGKMYINPEKVFNGHGKYVFNYNIVILSNVHS